MIRCLSDIQPIKTSHGVGEKRVLISSKESGCSLTQIAITELQAGEEVAAHMHPDMQEAFYVLSGELDLTLDGHHCRCPQQTFVYVDKCTNHELKAITDCQVMSIGCVISNQY